MPDLGSSGSKFAMLLMTEAKRLRRLLTFLKGRAWAIFEALSEEQTETYANLKTALLSQLSPDMDED